VTILLETFGGHGGILLLTDVEPLKYKYQIGLETLVVYTVNQWASYVGRSVPVCTLTHKCLAWGVRPQGINLNRLTGVCLNGGACGLIR